MFRRSGLVIAICASLFLSASLRLVAQSIEWAELGGSGDTTPGGGRASETIFEGGPVEGRIREMIPGKYLFYPGDWPAMAFEIENPSMVAPLAVGPMLSVDAATDVDPASILLSSVSLSRMSVSAHFFELDDSGFGGLSRIVDNFLDRMDGFVKPGAMNDAGRRDVVKIGETSLGEITEIYSAARRENDEELVQAAVESYRDIRRLKAIYDEYDNYPPWSYRRIFENSRSTVALGRPGATSAICSGVLVARDLVLTAGHCFSQDAPTDLEVWFDYAQDQDRLLPIKRRDVTALVAPTGSRRDAFESQEFGADLYDFAIVRFSPDPVHNILAPDGSKTQCLKESNPGRAKRLYVIGFPRGHRAMVHDNSRVYLPFRLRRGPFDRLELELRSELLGLENGAELLTQFTGSYVETVHRGSPAWELHDVRFKGMPMMGIVSDTFEGNSGSPVYDRDTHCVIGLFIGGAPDTGERRGASWEHHESVLPVLAILEELSKDEATHFLLDELTIR